MNLNEIGLATPFFFILIAIEYLLARRRKRVVYRLNDTVADMGCGIGDQLLALLVKGWTMAAYVACHAAFAQGTWSNKSASTWVVAFFGVDLAYYAFHRFSHRVNFGWATHVVHHQSEEYNLAVALRQSWFAKGFAWVFYLPLAVIGIPVEVYLAIYSANLLYQFWIHTRLIGRMGPFGWVFNTPSHHRVHHGTDPEYIDKNYAGTLIIWDRIFGTFVAERQEPTYGVSKPIQTWNPLLANVEPLTSLARRSWASGNLWAAAKLCWMPPEWTPQGLVTSVFPASDRGYDPSAQAPVRHYIIANFMPIIVITSVVLTFQESLSASWLIVASAFIMCSVMVWSGLSEAKRWARVLEWFRLAAATGLSGYLLTRDDWIEVWVAGLILAGWLLVSAWWGRVARLATAPPVRSASSIELER